jgi:hypothetical protein
MQGRRRAPETTSRTDAHILKSTPIETLDSKCNRALTFENFGLGVWSRHLSSCLSPRETPLTSCRTGTSFSLALSLAHSLPLSPPLSLALSLALSLRGGARTSTHPVTQCLPMLWERVRGREFVGHTHPVTQCLPMLRRMTVEAQ